MGTLATRFHIKTGFAAGAQGIHGVVLVSTAEAEAEVEADDEVVGVGCPTGPGEGFRAAIISSWAHLVVTLTFFLILTLLLTHFEL